MNMSGNWPLPGPTVAAPQQRYKSREIREREQRINIPLKLTAGVPHYYAAAVSSCLTSWVDWDFSPEVKDPLTGFKALAYRRTPVCNL